MFRKKLIELVHRAVMSTRTFKCKSTDSVLHFDEWISLTSPAKGRGEGCEFKAIREKQPGCNMECATLFYASYMCCDR